MDRFKLLSPSRVLLLFLSGSSKPRFRLSSTVATPSKTLAEHVSLSGADAESQDRARQAGQFDRKRRSEFALKVTLAGMIGYFFYTASDYFGIHTVFYTPLIIALGSTGATMHKGVLRVAGCLIGCALGMICTIWLIPRFETLGSIS
jgi:uncharacterized membrane protein YccC